MMRIVLNYRGIGMTFEGDRRDRGRSADNRDRPSTGNRDDEEHRGRLR
jgi:hypothetical protein